MAVLITWSVTAVVRLSALLWRTIRVHRSFILMYKLTFQILLNISLMVVTSCPFCILSSICFLVFASFHLLSYSFESSSIMSHCVLLSHTAALLACFFVMPCIFGEENFWNRAFRGPAACVLEPEVGCLYQYLWLEEGADRKGTASHTVNIAWNTVYSLFCALEVRLLKKEDYIIESVENLIQ